METDSTLIIAEAGVNHNGSLETARRLVDAAAGAGADCIKFQTFRASGLVAPEAGLAEYQRRNLQGKENTQYAMLKKLELSPSDHLELIAHCRKRNIRFFSTAFDRESIDFLASLELGFWKVPSGEITNYPYLRQIAGYRQPVLLSTGMSTVREIGEALEVLLRYGVKKEDITVLHCTTEYPAPLPDVNLRAMQSLGRTFGVRTGYSDHTSGIEVALAAVALGASVIEKHFTLDRNQEGPDHKASLEPAELTEMVRAIRRIELALGSPDKQVTGSEEKNRAVARKSIVAACDIAPGEILTEANLTVKRPGTGVSPMRWEEIVGTAARRAYRKDELIEEA